MRAEEGAGRAGKAGEEEESVQAGEKSSGRTGRSHTAGRDKGTDKGARVGHPEDDTYIGHRKPFGNLGARIWERGGDDGTNRRLAMALARGRGRGRCRKWWRLHWCGEDQRASFGTRTRAGDGHERRWSRAACRDQRTFVRGRMKKGGGRAKDMDGREKGRQEGMARD